MKKPNSPYFQLMRELGIEIIDHEETPKCHSYSMNPKKEAKMGIKIKSLRQLVSVKFDACFLRYRKGYWNIYFLPYFQPEQKGGGFSR